MQKYNLYLSRAPGQAICRTLQERTSFWDKNIQQEPKGTMVSCFWGQNGHAEYNKPSLGLNRLLFFPLIDLGWQTRWMQWANSKHKVFKLTINWLWMTFDLINVIYKKLPHPSQCCSKIWSQCDIPIELLQLQFWWVNLCWGHQRSNLQKIIIQGQMDITNPICQLQAWISMPFSS